jgi:hypothetical protein
MRKEKQYTPQKTQNRKQDIQNNTMLEFTSVGWFFVIVRVGAGNLRTANSPHLHIYF